ncbi:MAG: hypothetical protein AB7N73_15000 [Gemmatimonadales bacterium]
MARRKMPPRHKSGPKKGQFMKSRRRARPRRNPGRTVQAAANPPRRKRRRVRASSSPRRRRVRRNPPRRFAPRNVMRTLTDGAIEAGQVLVGKAMVRSVPDLAGLPKEGNVGLAIQAGVALVAGVLAEMFLSKDAARAILAGGLTAPLETVIVAYKVPWLAPALSPVSQTATLQAYVVGGNGRLGRYVRERLPAATASGERGLGSYASASQR